MSYMRERSELRTGYQENEPWSPDIDLQCDFIMVYGIDGTMPDRIRKYKEKGYVVHLMTGCSWGEYEDYLSGEWDGKEHWDESQMTREGKPSLHGVNVPYMVPTMLFAEYLTKKLRVAVDAGVEGIHMEEPEFWDNTGYSEAFKREYMDYYKEEWEAPHTSLSARYRCSRLKAYLYSRAIAYISFELKLYTKETYGRELMFYVPTHSLVNYTQWKIVSPESGLIDIPTVDGYIAQVWTGTSATGNVYQGHYGSHTFEVAFLEYGVMQELVKKTGRTMWFLHDPVEDFPEYTWEKYRYNYLKTVVASLFHPMVSRYEICPWPNRVFKGVYPRKLGMAGGMIPTTDMEGAKAIPKEYSSLLAGMAQLLGDMEQPEFSFEGADFGVGIFMSDSCLYQRSHEIITKDGKVINTANGENRINNALLELARREKQGEDIEKDSRALMDQINEEEGLFHDYTVSCAFPNFFGMSLPLLKYGLPIRPVQLDNITRFSGYLEDYHHLILSYEYMKPETMETNETLANWVKAGGSLIYIGDNSDPYHRIEGWWNHGEQSYDSPASHLFELLGLPEPLGNEVHQVEKGQVAVFHMAPARLTLNAQYGKEYRTFIKDVLERKGCIWTYRNHLVMKRGPYIIAAVMNDSCSNEQKVFEGLYADLLEEGYPIIRRKTVESDGNAILFDFAKLGDESVRVIGSCARVLQVDCDKNNISAKFKAADRIRVSVRLRVPKQVTELHAVDQEGQEIPLSWSWDEESRTVLLCYESHNETVTVKGGLR
ncbi:MAG TPA: hypothetical protein VHQ24_13890 [Lachnospiraceae bacterium]|nr:hypothetical protein [Lachnospiraceae bacterium]